MDVCLFACHYVSAYAYEYVDMCIVKRTHIAIAL